MLNKKLLDIFDTITDATGQMVAEHVDKKYLTGKVDFLSVYTQTRDEYAQFTKELTINGTVADVQTTGNYYWLNKPLNTSIGVIHRCRIRTPDIEHAERGYNDFEVINYICFKNFFLKKQYFSIVNSQHGIEMLELKDPHYPVRAYFPNIKFNKG